MPDLSGALHRAADTATADRSAIAAAPVLTRIRRRRTVRHASQGAVGLAAAGAVAVVGSQLAAHAPAGPAASSPTSLADSLTVGCGSRLADYVQPDGAPAVTMSLARYDTDPVEPANGPVQLAADVQADGDAAGRVGRTVTYTLVREGAVVAVPTDDWAPGRAVGFDELEPQGLHHWADVTFAACRPDGTASGAPEPGTYGVVAFLVPDRGDWPVPVRSTGVVVRLGEPLAAQDMRPALEDLVISTDGLGPVRLGEAPAADGPGAVLRWEQEGCIAVSGDGSVTGPPTGRWTPTYARTTTPFGTTMPPFGVQVVDGSVRRVDIVTAGPRTAAGIGVGSTLADVLAAYPDAESLGPVAGSGEMPARDLWGVRSGDRLLTFEVATDEPAVDRFTVEPGTVVAVVVGFGADHDGRVYVALGSGCGW